MASKVGQALGFGVEDEMSDMPEIPEEPASPAGGNAEVMAMKMFERATSPEAKAEAMKAFLEALGVYGS